jgi:hypothetical protein
MNNNFIYAVDWDDPESEGDHLINRGAGVQTEEGQAYIDNVNATEGGPPPELKGLFSSFDKITPFLVPTGIFLAVLVIVIGGYMWMTSAGSPDKVKQAQGTLTWAVIGLVFIIIAVLLVQAIIDYIVGM